MTLDRETEATGLPGPDDREREDALPGGDIAEVEAWRLRAENAEQQAIELRRECDELRTRIRELEIRLENILERERALDSERIDMTRRAAAARADAQRQLERLAAKQPDPALLRRRPKGNWLQP